MSYWRWDDGEVKTGDLSELTRRPFSSLRFWYGPPPGMWQVDPDNDWTIHQWVAQNVEDFETDYEPEEGDMPEEIAKHLEACAKQPSGKVY